MTARHDLHPRPWEGMTIIREIPPAVVSRGRRCERCIDRAECAANQRRGGAALCERLFIEACGAREVAL